MGDKKEYDLTVHVTGADELQMSSLLRVLVAFADAAHLELGGGFSLSDPKETEERKKKAAARAKRAFAILDAIEKKAASKRKRPTLGGGRHG